MAVSVNGRKLAAAAAALVMALSGIATPAHALEPVERDGWTLGLGLGLGHGEIVPPEGEGDSFYAKDGASHLIHIQRALHPRWRAGVLWQSWLTERGTEGLRIRRSMQYVDATVTWVPGPLDNAWSGFYLRGGAGLAHGRYSTAEPDEHGEDINMIATEQTGFALQGAIGYEFRVSSHVAAGMLFSYNHGAYGDSLFDTGWSAPLSVTLNWSF
jgi:hypothetical protein